MNKRAFVIFSTAFFCNSFRPEEEENPFAYISRGDMGAFLLRLSSVVVKELFENGPQEKQEYNTDKKGFCDIFGALFCNCSFRAEVIKRDEVRGH